LQLNNGYSSSPAMLPQEDTTSSRNVENLSGNYPCTSHAQQSLSDIQLTPNSNNDFQALLNSITLNPLSPSLDQFTDESLLDSYLSFPTPTDSHMSHESNEQAIQSFENQSSNVTASTMSNVNDVRDLDPERNELQNKHNHESDVPSPTVNREVISNPTNLEGSSTISMGKSLNPRVDNAHFSESNERVSNPTSSETTFTRSVEQTKALHSGNSLNSNVRVSEITSSSFEQSKASYQKNSPDELISVSLSGQMNAGVSRVTSSIAQPGASCVEKSDSTNSNGCVFNSSSHTPFSKSVYSASKEKSKASSSRSTNGPVSSKEERRKKHNDNANQSYHRRKKATQEANERQESELRQEETRNRQLRDEIRQLTTQNIDLMTMLLNKRDQALNSNNVVVYQQICNLLRPLFSEFVELITKLMILHDRASVNGYADFYRQLIEDCEGFILRLNEYECSYVLRNVEIAFSFYESKKSN